MSREYAGRVIDGVFYVEMAMVVDTQGQVDTAKKVYREEVDAAIFILGGHHGDIPDNIDSLTYNTKNALKVLKALLAHDR